jgi:hypothetical protein
MPDINVKGRYRIYTHDGVEPLLFTTYSNQLCSIRRPNPNTFITISTYIPGSLSPFTTFDPGSSYTIVTKSNTADFSMGPYTRADRLPSSVTFRSPNFYHGLDKNSITVALSSYALSVNSPLSTAFTYVPNQDGYFVNSISFNTQRFKEGLPSLLTHLTPNSSYQFINRTPFTFFAPLQSEMGDAYAWGENKHGQFGLGHLQDLRIRQEPRAYGVTLTAYNMYGIWENIEGSMFGSIYALSACGTKLKMFVTGYNITGQLGTGNQNDLSVFTQLTGDWLKVSAGSNFALALSSNGKLFSVGRNNYGQLGLGQSILSASTFTQVNDNIYSDIAAGGLHTLALDPNGALYGCGGNLYGELGLGRKTNSEFTLTREVSGGTFQLVRGGNNNSIVLSGGRMLGCGYQTQTNNYGTTDALAYSTFVPEASGFTDIVDVGMSSRYILINRSRDNDYWWYTGSTSTLNSAPGIQNSSSPYRRLTVNRSSLYKRTGTIMPIYDNTTGSGNFYFTARGYLRKYFSTAGDAEFYGTYSNLFGSRMGTNQTFFALTASNFRPTPTPTITPSPTPSPVPFAPYNTLEVGVFGQSFANSRTQLLASNTPGNLSNNFTLQTINDGNVPPDICNYSTFDYEKTTSLNNIVGIAIASALRNPRYLYRKVGNTWSYTLLPSNLDATSSSTYSYRGAETGTDSLFITPPHPQYSSSQGIYNLMFMRDEAFKEAISYDRGATWSISNFIGLNSEYQFSSLRGLTNKIFYSRTRDTNYEVQAVGYTDSAPMGGIPDSSLYFSRRFPVFSSPELIFDFGTKYIYGFDFKHDYFNIPTVASAGATPTSFGIYLHRKINGTWQTSIIKDNITNWCIGPTYKVPGSFSFYNRINSPIISIEFDSTNPDLVYIAYLRHTLYFAQGWADPAFIDVMCYNTRTNTIVFDEAVVRAKYESGSLQSLNSQYIDIPSLFFDTSNNTLNLFFFGVEYTQSSTTVNFVSYKMRRNGTNNWTAPTDLFPHTRNNQNRLNYLANSRELKTKY